MRMRTFHDTHLNEQFQISIFGSINRSSKLSCVPNQTRTSLRLLVKDYRDRVRPASGYIRPLALHWQAVGIEPTEFLPLCFECHLLLLCRIC